MADTSAVTNLIISSDATIFQLVSHKSRIRWHRWYL